MASGFQEQGKPSLSEPWKEENTLLIFQIAISHVPLTSSCLSTHPRSSRFPLVSHCISSCACTDPPAYHSLVAFSQALGLGPPVFLSPSGLYFLFPSLFFGFKLLQHRLQIRTTNCGLDRRERLPPSFSLSTMVRTPPTAFCLSYSMPETHLLPSNFLPASFPTVQSMSLHGLKFLPEAFSMHAC